MKTRIEKNGDGMTLFIPEVLAHEAGLEADDAVEIAFVEGLLVITPQAPDSIEMNEYANVPISTDEVQWLNDHFEEVRQSMAVNGLPCQEQILSLRVII